MPEAASRCARRPVPSRAMLSVVGLAYRRDPWRATLALVPVFPLLAGIIALSGRAILTVRPGQSSHVIVPAIVGGVALMAAAVVGYWQAANGLLRLAQVTSSELDFALLDRLSGVHTIDMYDDPEVRRPSRNAAGRTRAAVERTGIPQRRCRLGRSEPLSRQGFSPQ